jgi:hypothetical protein
MPILNFEAKVVFSAGAVAGSGRLDDEDDDDEDELLLLELDDPPPE